MAFERQDPGLLAECKREGSAAGIQFDGSVAARQFARQRGQDRCNDRGFALATGLEEGAGGGATETPENR
jgi:hypothetical protein